MPEPTQKAHPGEDVPEQDGEGGHGKGEYYHLNKLHKFSLSKVRMFLVVTLAYLIFWGPLFTVSCFCIQHIL